MPFLDGDALIVKTYLIVMVIVPITASEVPSGKVPVGVTVMVPITAVPAAPSAPLSAVATSIMTTLGSDPNVRERRA